MDVPREVQDKLAQFQNLQNQLQLVVMQKQQLMLQGTDVENARKELEALAEGNVYRTVGPLLVQTSRDEGLKYLADEGESASAKIKVLEKQEKKMVERLNEMRGQLQSMLQPPKAG